jgi:hypothetical protein
LAGGLAAFNVDLLMLLDNNIPVPRNIRSITIDVLSRRDTLLSITINAQLVSTETGAQVWADRLEGERKLGQTALRLSPHDDQASSWQLRLCYREGSREQPRPVVRASARRASLAKLAVANAWIGHDKEPMPRRSGTTTL